MSEISIPVVDGTIRARNYLPTGSAPIAALLWMHGGGFAGGSIDMGEADEVARAFARAGIAVLNVGYRLVPPLSRVRRWRGAPAVRFPQPVQDCVAGWRLLLNESQRLGVDAQRVFIGGASAGGNLAVMTTLAAARAQSPVPAGVVLAYPLLHARLPAVGDGVAQPASSRFAHQFARPWVRQMSKTFLGAANYGRVTEAFPQAGDLSNFPPTVIVVSERDALRASADAFVRDLRQHHIAVASHVEEGARHGHLNKIDKPQFDRTMATFIAWLAAHT